MESRKQAILTALGSWIRQRPGLDFGNYGDVAIYRAEVRSITRDLRDARTLLQAVGWRDGISADDLIAAAKHSYSGRLEIVEAADGKVRIDYCTGQYWPTEYRKAACAVLASALWDFWRDQPDVRPGGDALRKYAREEFGRGIASRWFN